MCGIVGVISTSAHHRKEIGEWERKSRDIVERGMRALAHRGPDGSSIYITGMSSKNENEPRQNKKLPLGAVFGHQRLSIIATESKFAKQPLVSQNGVGSVVGLLSFNGEIYNYSELGALLNKEGVYSFDINSDTSVLGSALAHWGVARTINLIDGMFAFAWWERSGGNNHGVLYLVRDPFGEKPLYYAENACGGLAFASEIKALLQMNFASNYPRKDTIPEFFWTGKVSGEATFFRDVSELLPGHILRALPNGELKTEAYFHLERYFNGSTLKNSTTSFPSLLDEAVFTRCTADVDVGILLSGGIDSCSLVESCLHQMPNKKLNLFSAGTSNLSLSEASITKRFVAHLRNKFPVADISHEISTIDFDTYLRKLTRLSWFYDEPVQFQNTPLLSGLIESAHNKDVKVLLSGEGADELLYGYDRFSRTSAFAAGLEQEERLRHVFFGGGLANAEIIGELCFASDKKPKSEAWLWLLKHIEGADFEKLQLIFSQLHRMQMLLQRQDRTGMANSVEIRVPFLAKKLSNYLNKLPISELYERQTATTKRPLRQAMRNRLPDFILNRPKVGFPSDMSDWLIGQDFRSILTTMLSDSAGFSSNYLNMDFVNKICERHFGEIRTIREKRFDMILWYLFSAEMWFMAFNNRDGKLSQLLEQQYGINVTEY